VDLAVGFQPARFPHLRGQSQPVCLGVDGGVHALDRQGHGVRLLPVGGGRPDLGVDRSLEHLVGVGVTLRDGVAQYVLAELQAGYLGALHEQFALPVVAQGAGDHFRLTGEAL
jgi:hypothetical protein